MIRNILICTIEKVLFARYKMNLVTICEKSANSCGETPDTWDITENLSELLA